MVHSKSKEKYANHLKIVLQTLEDQELYAKFSTCELCLSVVTLLGYIISSEGMKVDLQKTEQVKKWPRPVTLIGILRFLGLAGYCRRFLESFSSIDALLTRPYSEKGKVHIV